MKKLTLPLFVIFTILTLSTLLIHPLKEVLADNLFLPFKFTMDSQSEVLAQTTTPAYQDVTSDVQISGNVGINVSPSASYRLNVGGSTRLNGNTSIGGNTTINSGTSGYLYLGNRGYSIYEDGTGTDLNVYSPGGIYHTPDGVNYYKLCSAADTTCGSLGGGSLPSGTSGQTIRHDGSNWVASSIITNTGSRVGVGTNTPAAVLDVAHNSSTNALRITGGASFTGRLLEGWVNSDERFYIDVGGGFHFSEGSNATLVNDGTGGIGIENSLYVTNSGNVGIGTTTPGFPLNFSNSLGDKISLWGQSGDHYGFGIQPALLQIYADTSAGDIAFGYGQSSAFTERMRVRGNGNVGIGTNSPSEKLEVAGGIAVGGNPIYFLVNSTDPQYSIQSGAWNDGMKYRHWTSHQFITQGAERVRIDAAGNVGIGTTNPGLKLDVAGYVNSSAGGAYGQGGFRMNYHTLNSSSNGYLYLGDQNGSVYGSRGFAASAIWADDSLRSNNDATIDDRLTIFGEENGWGTSVINGRVWSSSGNIHLSPPGGSYVAIDSGYREAGGGTGNVNLNVSGKITGSNYNMCYQLMCQSGGGGWVASDITSFGSWTPDHGVNGNGCYGGDVTQVRFRLVAC